MLAQRTGPVRSLVLAAAVLVLAAGCDLNLFGPEIVAEGVRALDPVPEEYPEWYRRTESCLAESGDFEAIRWSVADTVRRGDGFTVGYLPEPDHIVMLDRYVEIEWAVRHEMVHQITGWGNDAHDGSGHFRCEVG